MASDKKYILGISLGIVCLAIFIALIFVINYLLKRNMQKKERAKKENYAPCFSLLKRYCNKNNWTFFNGVEFKLKSQVIKANGPILLSKRALVLTHPIYFDTKIDGNCIEREWYKISPKNENKQKVFPNPLLSDEMIIKDILDILPKNVPILLMFILINEEIEHDIYNVPGHIIFTNQSQLEQGFNEIITSLEETLDNKTIDEITKKIESFQK